MNKELKNSRVIDFKNKELIFISQDDATKEIISCISETLKLNQQGIEVEDPMLVPKKNSSNIDRDEIRSCKIGEFKNLRIESDDCQVIIDELINETDHLNMQKNSQSK